MYAASKILWWVFEPSNLVLLIFVVGTALLWTRRLRLARGLVALGTGLMVALAFVPFETLLIEPLENRFPRLTEIPADAVGLICLGGAVNKIISVERDQTTLSGAAERLTYFVALARRNPELRLVFTGGGGSLRRPELTEVPVVKRLFSEIGFDSGRVVYEGRSRNTHENAIFTYDLVKPAPDERWVLITSAAHMPRSVGVFRAAGWNVIPYPVDYNLDPSRPFLLWHGAGQGLSTLTSGLREWVGLIAYYLLGRTDELYPGPKESTS